LDSAHADAAAAAAAERFLVATGDWERCAELLAWRAARTPDGGDRRAHLWRLAELRRARLGQIDEATRLYVELAAGAPLPRLQDSPAVVTLARQDPALAVDTTRATAAPTPADRA